MEYTIRNISDYTVYVTELAAKIRSEAESAIESAQNGSESLAPTALGITQYAAILGAISAISGDHKRQECSAEGALVIKPHTIRFVNHRIAEGWALLVGTEILIDSDLVWTAPVLNRASRTIRIADLRAELARLENGVIP